jgi:hypothetical protein
VEVKLHVFVTSLLDETVVSGLTSRPLYLTGGTPADRWIGSWVGPSGDLSTGKENNLLSLPRIEPRFFGRPTCRHTD